MIHVICIGLMLGVKNFFIVGVLVGHNGIEDKMLGFIRRRLLVVGIRKTNIRRSGAARGREQSSARGTS